MNYEDFFKKAFADIGKDNSCPDHETIMNDVLERAKRMEKSKVKRHRILGAAAGTAAAVAAVGGSVLGLNFLNEHGGLKEGGNAAYHGEVTEAAEYPDITTNTLTDNIADDLDNMGVENHIYNRTEETEVALPEGLKYEFDGFTVEPRWCTFDGMTLHMAYDVISSGTLPEDVDSLVSLYGGAYECTQTSNESNRSWNRALIYATVCYAHMNNEVSVSFVEPEYFEDDKLDMLTEKAAETAFTVTRPDTAHSFSADTGMVKVKLTYAEDIVNVAHVDATYNAVSFKLGVTEELRNIALLYGFEPVIRLTDGTEIKPFSGQVPFEFATDYGLYIRFMVDTFDPAMIEEIYVNGVPLCNMEGAPDMEDEPGDILNAAGDVVEFDGLTATIETVDFDGAFLRVYYTPSGYEDGYPRSVQSIMMLSAYDPDAECETVFGSDGGAYDEETGLSCTDMFVDLDEGETVDICFMNSEAEKAGHYVLTGIDKSQNTCAYDINDNDIAWIRLSPFGAVIAGSENFTRDPKCSFSVIYKDGSSRKLYGESNSGGIAGGIHGTPIEEHFGLESGDVVTTFMTFSHEPIDVANTVGVEINRVDVALPVSIKPDFIESPEGSGHYLLSGTAAQEMLGHSSLFDFSGPNFTFPLSSFISDATIYDETEFLWYFCADNVQPVYAPFDGTIAENRPDRDVPGNVVTVRSEYGECWEISSLGEVTVQPGDSVAKGDVIGSTEEQDGYGRSRVEFTLYRDDVSGAVSPTEVSGEEALRKLMEYAGEEYRYPVNDNYTTITYYPLRDRFNLSALSDTKRGDPIYAAAGGTVVDINEEVIPGRGAGKYITIQAADGRKWQYSHCSELYAAIGDTVASGDLIAAVGATGWCTGPCLAIDFPEG